MSKGGTSSKVSFVDLLKEKKFKNTNKFFINVTTTKGVLIHEKEPAFIIC